MASLRKRGSIWYFRYTDADGVKQSRKGCSDKRTTEELARAAESEAAKVKAGLFDPKEAAYRDHEVKPLADHLADFQRSLLAKDGTPKHAQVTGYRVRRVLDMAKVERISGLSLSKVTDALQAIRTEDGFNQETINHYIRAVKAFSRWLWKDKRAREHNLAHLATSNPNGDRRYIRRPLTPEEAARVIEAAEQGPEVMGMTGPDRAMLYMVALGTGFRAMRELRPLTPERFNLDADPPTITVRAGYAKNGKEAVQPIAQSLADRLALWLAAKPPGRPVFDGMTKRTAEMLRVDLEAAGVPYETSEGIVDFHASRVAYISNLVASGASVKTCQTLARHSTPSLTIGVYAKASLHDIKGAVENLPDMSPRGTTPAEHLAMTGTDPVVTPISKRFGHYLATEGDGSSQDLSVPDVMASSESQTSMEGKPLKKGGSDGSSRFQSNTGGGSRTHTGVPPRGF